jgi:RNA-splicing ligase RtcB
MRDGCIIGSGKGNSDWNYSAPHGAGRVAGRADMNRKLESGEVTMDDFKEDMRGIYTCSVTEGTIDESSFAYKSPGDIIDVIQGNTIDIHAIIHPVFNLKDRGRDEDRKVNFQPPSRDIKIGI